MKIKKHENGVYYAHITGSSPINLKTRNAAEAKRLAADAKIAELEFAAKSKSLTQEVVVRLMAGRKATGEAALEAWQQHVKLTGFAPFTAHRYEVVIRQFLERNELWKKPLTAVTDADVHAFINTDEDIGKSTRINRLAAVQSFFAVASRHGFVIGDPSSLIEVDMSKLSFKQKEKRETKTFQPEEVKRMTVSLRSTFWRLAVFLANEFGLRMGDVATLEWGQFDLVHSKLTVWTDKHDKRITFPLSVEAKEILAKVKREPGEKFLFPMEASMAQDPASRSMLSTYFSREMKRLGLDGRSFHSLRHTFATRHAQEGESVDKIRERLGHSRSETTLGYIHKPE